MPRKAITITEARVLFPDFQPDWRCGNSRCIDPSSVAIGSPRFGTIRHVVVVETENDGTPIKPLWDQVVLEEGPKDHDSPGVIIVPYFSDAAGMHVVVRQRHRPIRGTNVFEFPQGGFETDETVTQCAARELEEETGLKAALITELAPVCAEPDWFTRGTIIVAALVNAKEAQQRRGTCFTYPLTDLSFTKLIDAATSLAALMRFLVWHQNSQ